MKTLSKNRVAAWMALCSGCLLVAGAALPAEKTLQNDSFTGSGQIACQLGAVEGEILAARFAPEPGDYPFTVKRIQVLVCPDGFTGTFLMTVWEDDGSSSSSSGRRATGSSGW